MAPPFYFYKAQFLRVACVTSSWETSPPIPPSPSILRSSDLSCWSHPCCHFLRKAFIDLCMHVTIPSVCVFSPIQHLKSFFDVYLWVTVKKKKRNIMLNSRRLGFMPGCAVHCIPTTRISVKAKHLLNERTKGQMERGIEREMEERWEGWSPGVADISQRRRL